MDSVRVNLLQAAVSNLQANLQLNFSNLSNHQADALIKLLGGASGLCAVWGT